MKIIKRKGQRGGADYDDYEPEDYNNEPEIIDSYDLDYNNNLKELDYYIEDLNRSLEMTSFQDSPEFDDYFKESITELKKQLKDKKYTVKLDPVPEQDIYPGRVIFDISVKKDIQKITVFKNTLLKLFISNQKFMPLRIKFYEKGNRYHVKVFGIIDLFDSRPENEYEIIKKVIFKFMNKNFFMEAETIYYNIMFSESEDLDLVFTYYEKVDSESDKTQDDIEESVKKIVSKTVKQLKNVKGSRLSVFIDGYKKRGDDAVAVVKVNIPLTIVQFDKKEIEEARKKLLKQKEQEKQRAKEQAKKQQKRKKNLQCHNDVEFILQENIEDFEPKELTQIILNKKTFCFENSSFQNMLKFSKDQKVRGDCEPSEPDKPLKCKWFYPINIGFNVFINEDSYKNALKNKKSQLWELKNKKTVDFTTGLHIMSEKSGKDSVYDLVPIKSQSGGAKKGLKRKPRKVIVMKRKNKKGKKRKTKS